MACALEHAFGRRIAPWSSCLQIFREGGLLRLLRLPKTNVIRELEQHPRLLRMVRCRERDDCRGDNDPETARHGRLTTTENCWTLGGTVKSPHNNILDVSQYHNCTTYGGNSGGPMYIEGTRVVIGLPFTYIPDYWEGKANPNAYDRRSPTNLETAAHLALTADFVSVHRTELLTAGIVPYDMEEATFNSL